MTVEANTMEPLIKNLAPPKKLSLFIYYFFLSSLLLMIAMIFGCLVTGIGIAATDSFEVRVGSELDFPPYAMVDKSGRPEGFSIDLIKAVADAMGLSIKITTGPWDTVWSALVARRLDVLPIVAKSPERQRLVDFSLPHTETYDAFFVRRGNPSIPNIAAAKGKEIVVMRSDAAHHALVERHFQGRLIPVDTIPAGLALIFSGAHDAFLCSKLIGTIVIKEHGLSNLTAGPPIPDYKRVFSFAVKKGDAELLEKLNQGLLIIKTNREYDRIYEKWLAADDPWRKLKKYLWPAVAAAIVIGLIIGVWLVMLQLLVKRRTRELRLAQEGLEEKVAQRTAELAQTNQALQSEITERQRAEEALKKRTGQLEAANRELEAFSYSVSHDLKAPVRAIGGFSRMLAAEHAQQLDEEGLRFLNVISSNTRLMAQLIDDLLALSRLGRQQVKKARINLGDLAKQVFRELQEQAPGRDLRLAVDDLPPAFADLSLMTMVLTNLLVNAIKYTKLRGSAVIKVGGQVENQETVYYVKDNGVGFDDRYADKLFGVFQRLHHGDEYEGTGVGLAIVKRIVEMHGGHVWAEGRIDSGATFYFALPKNGE